MERNFIYTNNWFDRNINISMKLLQTIFKNRKVDMLENLCNVGGFTFTSIDTYLTYDKISPSLPKPIKIFVTTYPYAKIKKNLPNTSP